MEPNEILSVIYRDWPDFEWVMLSGGEPAEQELKPLVRALHDAGLKVALETSATAGGHLGTDIDWVCVSPKIDMPGGRDILPEVVHQADEIKYVVGNPAHIKQLDQLLTHYDLPAGIEICLQPMSQSVNATALCVETVQRRGWRLSVQMHKYLNLP
jgi:7-carboxy-7-deazaguanine synthase